MQKNRKQWKKEIARIFATEIAKEVIRYGLGLLGLGLVIRFWGFLYGALSNAIALPVLQWSSSEFSVVLALLFLFLTLSFLLGRLLRPRQVEDEKFFFVEFAGFLWKTFRGSGRVEDLPYCKTHKSKIFLVGKTFACETCNNANTSELTWDLLEDLHKAATSRAEAIVFEHNKAKILT